MEAYLHEPNTNGLTAFHLAILYGHFFLLNYYMTLPGIDNYLSNDENSYDTLKVACRVGNIGLFKLLSKYIKNWLYTGKDSYTILHYACGSEYIQIYNEVINKCKEFVNKAPDTPLHWAVSNQRIAIVKKLITIEGLELDIQNNVRVFVKLEWTYSSICGYSERV